MSWCYCFDLRLGRGAAGTSHETFLGLACVGPIDRTAEFNPCNLQRSDTPKHRAPDWARRSMGPKSATARVKLALCFGPERARLSAAATVPGRPLPPG